MGLSCKVSSSEMVSILAKLDNQFKKEAAAKLAAKKLEAEEKAKKAKEEAEAKKKATEGKGRETGSKVKAAKAA